MKKEKFKKRFSGTISAMLALSCLQFGSFSDNIIELTSKAEDVYFTSVFDNDTDGWHSRGSSLVSVDTDNYYGDGSSLFVSGRSENWNGAATELSADTFRGGETYSFSAAVLQKSGAPVEMKMTLQYNIGGTERYDEIALIKAESGVWSNISNSEYTIPENASDLSLYIEATDSLTDYCIDSFTAAEKGVPSGIITGSGVVDGIEKNSTLQDSVKGDFDGSGTIDVFDMLLARRAVADTFSGSAKTVDLAVADLDGNGCFSVNDVVLLSKFILGQINTFPVSEIQTTTTVSSCTEPTTTAAAATPISQNTDGYMEQIASDMQISAPASFTQERAWVDYGTMEKKTYYSKDGGITKNVNILLPPGYNTNEKYPVLYVLHGIFGDETSMPGMGIQTMLGNLIADGEAEKMIIVFPAMFTGSGSPGFTAESSRKYDLIREDIENSIMPFLEENYSVRTGRENTAITGFSMGGREALYTGVSRSEVYGYVGAACPAPGIFPTTDSFMSHEGCMTESEFQPSVSPYMLLISAAANDGVVGTYPQTYHEALSGNGVRHLWQIIPDGDHGGATVTPHMYNFLRYVFKA